MKLDFNKYQKIAVAIIVVLAVVITGTAVFVITSCCNKSDSNTVRTTNSKETTTVVKTTKVEEAVLYVKDEDGINLREKPDKSSKLIDTLAFGTKVISAGAEGEWSHVKVGNKVGYVKTIYLIDEKGFKKLEKKEKKAKAKTKSADGSGKVICIDPGHQSHQNSSGEPIGPGASQTKAKVSSGTSGVATGVPEYKLTLQVSKKLKSALTKQGYKVVMTRETNNVDISNSERAKVANNANADAFLRIHANGGGASANGIMTLCPTANNPYCSTIYSKSRKLSDCILKNMLKTTGANSAGVSEVDDMTGINWSKVPVTIVEMGYMSNAAEDKKMAQDSYQDKLVAGMVNGLADYFK